ncbi:MAG: hypothetical protein ACE5IY_21150 [bacterium]
MNIPLLIAGLLTLVAFLAHTFVGTKETMQIAPGHNAGEGADVETAGRHWVQAMCAFQMVTADLLILSASLIMVAVTDLIEHESIIILLAGSFFVLYLISWLTTLLLLKQKRSQYLFLGQWILWLVNSGLIYWGYAING